MFYKKGSSAAVAWPVSDNVTVNAGIEVRVSKDSYPDNTRIGVKIGSTEPWYEWESSGNFWVQSVAAYSQDPVAVSIVIDGSNIGGTVTISLS